MRLGTGDYLELEQELRDTLSALGASRAEAARRGAGKKSLQGVPVPRSALPGWWAQNSRPWVSSHATCTSPTRAIRSRRAISFRNRHLARPQFLTHLEISRRFSVPRSAWNRPFVGRRTTPCSGSSLLPARALVRASVSIATMPIGRINSSPFATANSESHPKGSARERHACLRAMHPTETVLEDTAEGEVRYYTLIQAKLQARAQQRARARTS